MVIYFRNMFCTEIGSASSILLFYVLLSTYYDSKHCFQDQTEDCKLTVTFAFGVSEASQHDWRLYVAKPIRLRRQTIPEN